METSDQTARAGTRKPTENRVFCSPTWIRTKNLSVNSRLLYQLSYGGSYEQQGQL